MGSAEINYCGNGLSADFGSGRSCMDCLFSSWESVLTDVVHERPVLDRYETGVSVCSERTGLMPISTYLRVGTDQDPRHAPLIKLRCRKMSNSLEVAAIVRTTIYGQFAVA